MAVLSTARAAEKSYEGRVADGTVGLGFPMYEPPCAYMCRNSATGWMLECPDDQYVTSTGHHKTKRQHGDHMMPSPQCYASNDPFLQTLAWCIHTHCGEDVSISDIEAYWENNVAGNMQDPPPPSRSYQEALANVSEEPTAVLETMAMLNETSLVDEWLYQANWGANWGIVQNMAVNNQYTLVILLVFSMSPILLSILRLVPFPRSLVVKFYATFIDPPAFSTRHAVPVLFGLGIMPTRGQMLLIAFIWVINVVLSAVNYSFLWPTLWYTEMRHLVMCSIANRVGMLSFANLSLAVLYASRNNLLMWVTNWSRSTFVLVHRWLAVICIIQAFLHSVLYFTYHGELGMISSNAPLPYYYWGIIGMVVMVVIMPISILPVRRMMYEVFLATHVVLVIFILIGCFLHIYFRYHWQWGYEIWTALAFALWGFDRFLARPLRLAMNGVNRAYIRVVDEDYLQVQVPGVDATGHAYLYFPTLSWRIWENHPFSVIPTPGTLDNKPHTGPGYSADDDIEQGGSKVVHSSVSALREGSSPGITFFIRRRGGLTSALAKYATSPSGVRVLVESSYGPQSSLLPTSTPSPSLTFPNVICIAGGVGITGILPLLQRSHLATQGATKLYWGVRTEPLVQAVDSLLTGRDSAKSEGGSAVRVWGGAEVRISVGSRFALHEILEREILEELNGGTTVVVCGPPGMSDEVRTTVSELARRGGDVRFFEERFGW